jgi:excisionase family DNA binding protein
MNNKPVSRAGRVEQTDYATFEPLLSDAEAGSLLGLHPKTVQRLARRGELPAVRIGRYWRFRASALNHWIDLNSTGQPLTERIQ